MGFSCGKSDILDLRWGVLQGGSDNGIRHTGRFANVACSTAAVAWHDLAVGRDHLAEIGGAEALGTPTEGRIRGVRPYAVCRYPMDLIRPS